MYIQHEGLGREWYESLLDVAAETGASVVEGYGGKAAGDAVRGLHRGWTGAVLGSKPNLAIAPRNRPAAPPPPPPAYYPMPPPVYVPAPPPPAPFPPAGGDLVPHGRFAGSASLSGSTVVLLGGLGLGALLLVLAMKKNHVPH